VFKNVQKSINLSFLPAGGKTWIRPTWHWFITKQYFMLQKGGRRNALHR